MNNKERIEKLKVLKEQFAAKSTLLSKARQLRESASATNLSKLLENDLEQAELILAAKDVLSQLQNMAEDLAKIGAQDVMPLVDNMKGAFGPDAALAFEQAANASIQGALEAVRNAKDSINTAILQIQGEVPPGNDMNTPMGGAADLGGDLGGDMGADLGATEEPNPLDDFAGADAASGPEDEPLGRARKESLDLGVAGKKLLVNESLDSLIGWLLDEAAVAMPAPELKTFARKVAVKGAKSPEKLAGWIGQKKYGAAAMAQLATPAVAASAAPVPAAAVAEGKTRKDSEENASKNDYKKDRRAKNKDLEEAKKFDDEDEDDDSRSKSKKRDLERKTARKNKVSESTDVTTAESLAVAIAEGIAANIQSNGRGNAAAVVSRIVGDNLAEGEDVLVLEAFASLYGMTPAQFSIKAAKGINEAPLNTSDQKKAAGVMGKLAQNMATDKTLANKPMSAALNTLDASERATANKMTNVMKQNTSTGQAPKKVGDFIDGAEDLNKKDGLGENINAAHWPTDSAGQYKGEPFSTDYGKLKAKNTTKSDTTASTASASPEGDNEIKPDNAGKGDSQPAKDQGLAQTGGETENKKPAGEKSSKATDEGK